MLVTRLTVSLVFAFALAGCTTRNTAIDDDGDTDGGADEDGGANGRRDGGGSNADGGDPYRDGGVYENDADAPPSRPPPIITSVAPLAGAYGTLVTITGDNLDETNAQLVLDGPGDPVEVTQPAAGAGSLLVVKWSKTEIQFKYPFPADGPIRINTKAGSAEGGTFVPSYKPGTPLSGVYTRRELLAVVSPAAGTVVAAFDGATGPQILVAYPDGRIEPKPYNRGFTGISAMSLYATAAGGVDGFYASGGKLWTLTNALTAPVTAVTTVSTTLAAGARDATGPYAWIKKGTTFVRVRPPTWAESGAAITDPTPASAPGPSIAVSGADHSFFAGWGVNDSGSFPLYDHTAHAVARRLRVGQTTFDASRIVGGGADDYMVWTRFLAGPDGRLASYFCANDTGAFSSPSVDCGEGYAGNGTPVPTGLTEYVVGHNATTAIAASCEAVTSTIKLGPEAQTAQQLPIVFPCPRIVTVGVDPSNAGFVLLQVGNKIYSPRKR